MTYNVTGEVQTLLDLGYTVEQITDTTGVQVPQWSADNRRQLNAVVLLARSAQHEHGAYLMRLLKTATDAGFMT